MKVTTTCLTMVRQRAALANFYLYGFRMSHYERLWSYSVDHFRKDSVYLGTLLRRFVCLWKLYFLVLKVVKFQPVVIWQLLNEAEWHMKFSAGRGDCYQPRPKAEVDKTLRDLQNSSYPMKAVNSIIALLFIQNIFSLRLVNLLAALLFFVY